MNKAIVQVCISKNAVGGSRAYDPAAFVGLLYRESFKTIGSFLIVIAILAVIGLIAGFEETGKHELVC